MCVCAGVHSCTLEMIMLNRFYTWMVTQANLAFAAYSTPLDTLCASKAPALSLPATTFLLQSLLPLFLFGDGPHLT